MLGEVLVVLHDTYEVLLAQVLVVSNVRLFSCTQVSKRGCGFDVQCVESS